MKKKVINVAIATQLLAENNALIVKARLYLANSIFFNSSRLRGLN